MLVPSWDRAYRVVPSISPHPTVSPRGGKAVSVPSVYDHVIVGAGAAGCALAARLSEDPDAKVLLLEAGKKDRSPNIKIPAAFSKQFRTKLDWDFTSGPEPHLGGRELFVPRGRSL